MSDLSKSDRRKERRRSLRVTWIAIHGPCQRCGSWQGLTIDHIDKSTKDVRLKVNGGGTSPIWDWPELERMRELAKCQTLCVPCHRNKTRLEDIGDPLERQRMLAELQRRRDPAILKDLRWREMLAKKIDLPAEIEARIEEIRARYGFWEEEPEKVSVAPPVVAPKVEDWSFLRDLIKMP